MSLTGGDVAFAEAYMDGRWDTSDLTTLLTVLAFNQRALERAFYGRWWRQLAFRFRHVSAQQLQAAQRARTSSRTTISATTSTGCGSTRQ